MHLEVGQGVVAHHFEAMGTTCAVFAVGADQQQLKDAERWVLDTALRFTRFDPESELSRLNAAAGRWMDVSPDLESGLRDAQRAYDLSGGLVNVAVLPAMLAIGYSQPMAEGPGPVTLGEARALPALSDVLDVARGCARVRRGAGIDLGGIAKGWMADRLVRRLADVSMANLGGDLMARGAPGGEGWPVGLGGRTVLLRDQGAATSSVRRRRWGRLHHLIDPRTGLPAETGLTEVSVVAVSATEAEIVAKAALLLGPDIAPTYCAAHAFAWQLEP
jgi:FAD:protein FMN transferase